MANLPGLASPWRRPHGTKAYVLAVIEHGTRRIWSPRHLMAVLREYEDFSNTHRPHRTLNQAAPFRRCQMASPTWITSASGGATAPEA
jgi:hypothetical protein